MPTKIWAVGEEVLAADFNDMVQEQVVATFPNAAARTAAIPAPGIGMASYLQDNRTLETWNGTSWGPSTSAVAAAGSAAGVRFRVGQPVFTTDVNGNFLMNMAPPLGPSTLSASAVIGDNTAAWLVQPYWAQFTAGATSVTWTVKSAATGSIVPSATIRISYLIVDTFA